MESRTKNQYFTLERPKLLLAFFVLLREKTMARFPIASFAVGLILIGCITHSANAQPGGFLMLEIGRWESHILPLKMIRNEQIANHLVLSKQQLEGVENAVKETHQQIDAVFKEHLREHSKEELRTISDECRKIVRKFPAQLFAQLEKGQSKKLNQICSRFVAEQKYDGIRGFLLSQEADQLHLNEAQLEALRNLKSGTEKECLELLDEKQREYFGTRFGEPIDFARLNVNR